MDINPTADVNSALPSTTVGGKFNDFLGGVVGLFDKGLDVWKSTAERVQAIKEINKESDDVQTVKVAVGEEQSFFDKKDNKNLLLIGGASVGALVLILLLTRR